jgi:hypothetical protein
MCCRGIFIRSLLGTVLGMSASSAGSCDLFGPVLVEMRERFPLGVAIHRIALLQDLEIDVVGVELRSIDTGESSGAWWRERTLFLVRARPREEKGAARYLLYRCLAAYLPN